MNEKIYTAEQIKNILAPVFTSYNVKKAVLFGSYAKGSAAQNSDVDLWVDSGLKGLAFFGLLEDVVTALGKSVDLLDASQVLQGSEVEKYIFSDGITIYKQ